MTMEDEANEWLTLAGSALLPSDAERALAADAHQELRSALRTGEMERRILRSYLTGSYVRHTATTPLNDVDVVFEVDHERWRKPRSAFIPLLGDDDLPDPDSVITTFARAIRDRLGSDVRVRKQRCSVGVMYRDIHVDAVPALPVAEDNSDDGFATVFDSEEENDDEEVLEDIATTDRIRIPDRESGRWIESNPKAHVRIGAALNADSDGLFKPTVRLLKAWNVQTPFSSFAIETLAGHAFRGRAFPSLLHCLDAVWDFVCATAGKEAEYDGDTFGVDLNGLLTPATIPDLAGTENNVAARYDRQARRSFVDAAEDARARLRAAVSSRKDTKLEEKLERLFKFSPHH